MNISAQHSSGLKIPFDHKRLDRLMDQAGIDVVIATSKHNVQYLLGGHRADTEGTAHRADRGADRHEVLDAKVLLLR